MHGQMAPRLTFIRPHELRQSGLHGEKGVSRTTSGQQNSRLAFTAVIHAVRYFIAPHLELHFVCNWVELSTVHYSTLPSNIIRVDLL